MVVYHIAYRYLPMIGGLERYIGLLLKALHPLAPHQRVFQCEPVSGNEDVCGLGREPGLPKQVGFALRLRRSRAQLAAADLLVVHQPEFFPAVAWHPRVIVVSHCATWTAESAWLRRIIRRAATVWAWRRAPGWIVNSTFVFRSMGVLAAPARRPFEELARHRWYVPNCVDTGMFAPDAPADASLAGSRLILVPRNFTAPRGIDLALHAVAAAEKAQRFDVAFAGEPIYDHARQRRYAGSIQQCVEQLSMTSRVRFLGFVRPDQMPGIYRAATMSLIPTRSSEGTSLAALESMACATPTLSTDVEGLLDLPTAKCRAEVGDMASGIERTLEQGPELGRQQCAAVREQFGLERWQKAWIAAAGTIGALR